MISYTYGDWDILRAKDLKELDKKIQLSNENKSKYFPKNIFKALPPHFIFPPF